MQTPVVGPWSQSSQRDTERLTLSYQVLLRSEEREQVLPYARACMLCSGEVRT